MRSMHIKEAKRRQERLKSPGARLPNRTIVTRKLPLAELNGVPSKLAPKYAGPWVVVDWLSEGMTI